MRAHLCCILAALLSAKPAAAYIAGAFVLPHGSIAQAPQHFNTTCTGAKADAEARAQASTWSGRHAVYSQSSHADLHPVQGHEIHEACVAVGKEIARLKPDLILLSTPHGITDLGTSRTPSSGIVHLTHASSAERRADIQSASSSIWARGLRGPQTATAPTASQSASGWEARRPWTWSPGSRSTTRSGPWSAPLGAMVRQVRSFGLLCALHGRPPCCMYGAHVGLTWSPCQVLQRLLAHGSPCAGGRPSPSASFRLTRVPGPASSSCPSPPGGWLRQWP